MPLSEESDFEQLKLLFDYTKFHILLYTSIVTLLIGLFLFGVNQEAATQFRQSMKVIVFFFVIAGGAGGVIGSSIPGCKGFSDFSEKRLAPYGIPFLNFKGKTWVAVEHGAFWIGITIATFVFLSS
jgi:hypothetical protein